MNDMTDGAALAELLKDLKATGEKINKANADRVKAFDDLQADFKKHGAATALTADKMEKMGVELSGLVAKFQTLEESVNEIHKWRQRPGPDHEGEQKEQTAARDWLLLKYESQIPKRDPDHPFQPTQDQIAEAVQARKALSAMLHTTSLSQLSEEQRKSLSAFNFGSHGFILSPEISNRILSCLLDRTDVTGLVQSMTIAGPAIQFPIDNVEWDRAAWACESSCFANNPQPNLNDLGYLEIKPETLRYIVCSTRDILEDASINIEQWMMGKVQRAFRHTISNALICGDGVGKPIGVLHPNAGIPLLETGAATPTGQISWQDVLLLQWEVPMQYHSGNQGSYWMNQHTLGLILTMSDAVGRPMFAAMPHELGWGLTLAGSRVQIVSQMPDVAPGATPIAWGNWPEVYLLVNRKAVTIQQDPYSAGFCILWKFESRVGGGIICPGAARLLRIR